MFCALCIEAAYASRDLEPGNRCTQQQFVQKAQWPASLSRTAVHACACVSAASQSHATAPCDDAPGPCTLLPPGKPLERAQLLAELGLLFGAGFETTAHTICWALFCLVTNPAAEQKVLQELDSLGLLASPSNPEPRALVWEDLGKLRYLTAALNESMRLYPVVSTGTARITHEWTRVGPYLLPPKVPIITPFYSIHRSPRLWPKADQYLPERWLDSSSSSSGTKLAEAGVASGAEQGGSSPASSHSSSTGPGAAEAAGDSGGRDRLAADAPQKSSGSQVLDGAASSGAEDVRLERDQDASPQVSHGDGHAWLCAPHHQLVAMSPWHLAANSRGGHTVNQDTGQLIQVHASNWQLPGAGADDSLHVAAAAGHPFRTCPECCFRKMTPLACANVLCRWHLMRRGSCPSALAPGIAWGSSWLLWRSRWPWPCCWGPSSLSSRQTWGA